MQWKLTNQMYEKYNCTSLLDLFCELGKMFLCVCVCRRLILNAGHESFW